MTIRLVIAATTVLTLTVLGCQSASAYDRSTTLTTAHGTYTKSVDASCAGGACSRNAEVVGPNGRSYSRSTKCRAGWRYYACSGTVTGPNGRSATRHVAGRRFFH